MDTETREELRRVLIGIAVLMAIVIALTITDALRASLLPSL